MKRIEISKNESDQRLDRFLNKYFRQAGKNTIQKMIRKKQIRLNGKHPKASSRIYLGDLLNIYISDEDFEKFRGEERVLKGSRENLDIIFEDENLLIVNKPSGLLTHAAEKKDYGKNLLDILIAYLIEKGDYIPRQEKTFKPAFVNRLDRNTSGLLILAKNNFSLVKLNEAMRNKKIKKYYRTIVKGRLDEERTIKLNLKKDEDKNRVMESDSGKYSETKIRPLKTNGDYSLLEVQLVTGRTHQIRISLSQIGHPIIGDSKYGEREINRRFREDFSLNNQLLQAYKLTFLPYPGLEKYEGRTFMIGETEEFSKIERAIFKED